MSSQLRKKQRFSMAVTDILDHPPIPIESRLSPKQSDMSHNQQDFYEEYKRVLGISFEIQKQLHNHCLLKEELVQRIAAAEKNMEANNLKKADKDKPVETIPKRNRRMAQEIQRKYKCSVKLCDKQYGSEGSLIQHIKLKHPELYYPSL